MIKGHVSHHIASLDINVDFDVDTGNTLALFGASASGKSTILKMIAGLIRPNMGGHISIKGRTVFDSQNGIFVAPHMRRIGYVAQDYGLFPHLSVESNISYGLGYIPKSSAADRVNELLNIFGLVDIKHKKPNQLSGGEQQRVAIARAIANRPDALLLDEPFSSLDYNYQRVLRRQLKDLSDSWDIPIILVTHDVELAVSVADKVAVLDNGRLTESDPFEMLSKSNNAALAHMVGVDNVYKVRVINNSSEDGTMTCKLGDVEIIVPRVDVVKDSEVGIGIRSADILLASERPQGLSAQNIIHSKVVSVVSNVDVSDVILDCGISLKVSTTHKAIGDLKVAEGGNVWAVIKTNSILLLDY